MSLCLGCEIERIEQMIRHTIWMSGARGIVIGISGGIDSAVAAVLCSGAVGGEKVLGLTLPSQTTVAQDIEDAETLCEAFGIRHRIVSIEPMLTAFSSMSDFEDTPYLLGNVMARVRMTALYYHANRTQSLVCGTSNRSEYMLGYCTKFGDNAADLQPILHLYKTEIFELAAELGIPESIRTKPPSAGLWIGQSDEQELGLNYREIDAALRNLERTGWMPETENEELVIARVKSGMHKRMPAPHLLTTSREDP
jgi:NAD+ synthase